MQFSKYMNLSLVSVILPVFNGEKFLRDAIDSILAQTYTNFELIIINDFSTDHTESIILSYNDDRILYIKNEQNLGVANTLNKGIDLAKGQFIARMDADDISKPDRIEKQMAYLDSHPEVAVIDCIMEYIDENGQLLNRYNNAITTPEDIKARLSSTNCIGHPSILVRRAIFDTYRYRRIYYEDYDLWLRVVNDGHIIHKLNEPLLLYRLHGSSITGMGLTNKKHFYKLGKSMLFYYNSLSFADRFKPFNLQVFFNACKAYATWLWKIGKLQIGK